VDNTLATPIWFFVVFEPVYPLGNYPTVKGTVPIQQDQTGKLYANIYVKATSSVVAFSSATDLGTFAFAYRLAFQSECDSFGGALSSSASTQFCYRMECPEDSYCTFDVSTDLYSPLSVRVQLVRICCFTNHRKHILVLRSTVLSLTHFFPRPFKTTLRLQTKLELTGPTLSLISHCLGANPPMARSDGSEWLRSDKWLEVPTVGRLASTTTFG
jgi:hypothetical protein